MGAKTKIKATVRRRAPKGGCYVAGRFFRGGCFLPAVGDISTVRIPGSLALTDEQRLLAALARLPSTIETARAMARVLRGTFRPGDDGILKQREITALQQLRDDATTQTDWTRWHARYLRLVGAVL